MGFNAKYYAEAEEELKQRRLANLKETDRRLEEVIGRFPEYARLRAVLSATGMKIAEAVLSGGDVRKKIEALEAENYAVIAKTEEMLVMGGYPRNYLEPVYSCLKCSDTGIDSNGRCECYKSMVKRLAADGINSKSPLTLTGFDSFVIELYPDEEVNGRNIRSIMQKNFEFCKNYAEDFFLPNTGILLCGETGLGKTHLSLAIAGRVLANGFSAIYGSAPDLFRKIESEHFGRAEFDNNTADTLIAADLLVLDDVGAEFNSPFYVSVLYNILNSRMNSGLPLIISTNLTTEELKTRYGERIVSRLISMKVLKFYGKDIRLIRRKA
ncbi:MAG: ATP-binding protein [Oscillospiraceae bacterium]|nr:ATP-binding protein [Oscillospiraceae bacterium]